MTTEVQDLGSQTPEAAVLQHATLELAQVQECIGPSFRRAEARTRAGRFLRASAFPSGTQKWLAACRGVGRIEPTGGQRLLAEADWDEEGGRDELRRYVVEHLGDADGVLGVDETGLLKKGKKSAGGANQYSGAAHGLARSQVGVFLLYASTRGAAFLDRDVSLPDEWLMDPVRCREAGIPQESTRIRKGELAKGMLARACAAQVPADWVVGDTLYGYDELRLLSCGRAQTFRGSHCADARRARAAGRQQPIGSLAALLPDEAWTGRIVQEKEARDHGSYRVGLVPVAPGE